MVVSGLYFLNRDFRLSTNSVMSIVPGPIGEFFEKYPTKAEEQEQVREVSAYFLQLSQERAVDKLLALRGEDKRIYDEVLKDMLRINPNKTRAILEAIRGATLSKDALSNTVDRITEEKSQNLISNANYIASLPVDLAVDEVMKIIEDSINGHQDAADIFNLMDTQRAMSVLYRLNSADRNRIFSFMENGAALAIKNAHTNLERQTESLRQLASVYRTESALGLADLLGNTGTYTMDELAVVFRALGAKKSGEVLSKVDNDAFIMELVSKMKANEILEKGNDEYTPDVLKALKIYKEFDDNVKELVNIYARMPNDKVVDILQNMMINASPSTVYALDNGDLIMLSDNDLVLALMSSFTEKKKSEILTMMDRTLSTELTRQLALPKN